MQSTPKAIIFDMDGVLIDSEPLWKIAMIKGFKAIGIPFTENDCKKTTGMRFTEVVQIWFNHFKITTILVADFEDRVITILIDLINKKGKPIDGVLNILNYCQEKNIKMGLATSSSIKLMNAVLTKLQIQSYFSATISAQNMTYGKPHPKVFLVCAKQLNINANNCLVIEDSVNGVIAAKAAQMQVIAVPDSEHFNNKKFAVADYKFKNMTKALLEIKRLFN